MMYEYQNHLTEPPIPVGGYLPKTISDEELKKIIKDQADMCMAILNGDDAHCSTMTNKEAIEKLKEILFMTGYKEALDLAIKAIRIVEIVENCFKYNRSEGLIDSDYWEDIKKFVEPVEDKQTCDNCGQDHKYCEPTNKEEENEV